MSSLTLAAAWCAAAAGVLVVPHGRHRRVAVASLAIPVLISLLVRPVAGGGPLSGSLGVSLGRAGLSLLAASSVSLVLTLALAPRLEPGSVVVACLVGAAAVVVMSATSPLLWAAAIAVAVGLVALNSIAVAPGRSTLAIGRVGGLGAAALVAVAPFVPAVDTARGPAAPLVGGLLAGGVAALLGMVPLGGWASGAISSLRGPDVVPWMALMTPAILLSASEVPGHLSPAGRGIFLQILLVTGLTSAVWSAVRALRVPPRDRYGRVFLSDLALAGAAVGSGTPAALTGGLLVLVVHLAVMPTLANPARAGLERPRRLLWLALSGIPPSPVFWGRFLLLESCAAAGGAALMPAIAATGCLLLVGIVAVVGQEPTGGRAGLPVQTGTWILVVVALGLGLAPETALHAILGPT